MTTKIGIYSDLHLEFDRPHKDQSDLRAFSEFIVEDDADIRIYAGDIALKQDMVDWMLAQQGVEIIYVLGNHEFYGQYYPDQYARLASRFEGTNVHLLERSTVTLDGIEFAGATLWTDFCVFGAGNAVLAALLAQSGIVDFRAIRSSPDLGFFTPDESIVAHRAARRFLEDFLSTKADSKRVVVTHHAPAPGSIAAQFADNALTPAFVSDLSALIESMGPDLWVHGHTHTAFDYHVGRTRVICNPRGYVSAGEVVENFQMPCVVTLD